MIKASQLLKDFIKAQEDKDDLAKRFGISRRTLHSIETGDDIGHADNIAGILKETGMDFEKAFEVEE